VKEEGDSRSGEEIDGGGHGVLRWIWIVLAVVLFYLLSIGPVMVLTLRCVFPARTMIIYQPVIRTAHMSGWLDRCLWQYCKLWGVQ
jgi:hypothetical protein